MYNFHFSFSFFILLFHTLSFSQITDNSGHNPKRYEIDVIGQYPEIKTNKRELKKIFKLIFGEEQQTISKPFSVLKDSDNNLWFTDQGLSNIVKVENNVGYIPRLLKKGKLNLLSVIDICNFQKEQILFTDSKLNRVYLLDENQKLLKEFSSDHKFNRPTGIAYSSLSKEVYVVETASHCISVFDKRGKYLRSFGRRGSNTGEFNYPTFICVDKLGIIYVIDSLNFRIQIFDKNGKFLNAFGEHGNGTGCFAGPKGIAIDSKGNIYIADALFHAIQIFDKDGNFLYSFGSQGTGNGQFWLPVGIFIDENDVIYVADSYNSRIQIFKLIPKQEY